MNKNVDESKKDLCLKENRQRENTVTKEKHGSHKKL